MDCEREEDDDLADAPDSHVCPISFQLMVRTPDPRPITLGKPTCPTTISYFSGSKVDD